MTPDAADQLLNQIAIQLAAEPDLDDLALEVIRRLVVRRARELLDAGEPIGAVDQQEPDRNADRLCTRCRHRQADAGFKSCTRCRDWARQERRLLRARKRSDTSSATRNGATGGSSGVVPRSEMEMAASGARGPRAAEIVAGARDPNALQL
jgi:hypothetical protein